MNKADRTLTLPHICAKEAPRSAEAEVAERTMRFVASDETVDSYGDIVSADGWDLRRFQKNPQVLFAHNHRETIGKAVDVGVEGKRLMARIEFAPEGTTETADNVWKLLKAGFLRAVSVGFAVHSDKDYEYIYDDEENVTGFRYLRQELLEISVVSVPANPNALAVARGLKLPEDFIRRALPLDASITQRNRAHRLELMQLQLAALTTYAPRQAVTQSGQRP